jgi:hypothetical protein
MVRAEWSRDWGPPRPRPPVRLRFVLAAIIVALLASVYPSAEPTVQFTITKLERK